MTPNKFASELRRIASTLERSKRPSPTLVLKDINKTAALIYLGEKKGWVEDFGIDDDEESEEELVECESCGAEVPEGDLSSFGPEGNLCHDCLVSAQGRYRGKPMDYLGGGPRRHVMHPDDRGDYDRDVKMDR